MTMSSRRVVITGMGTVNSLGLNVREFWDGLKNGKSGITRVTNVDLKDSPCLIGGEVKNENFNVEDFIDKKDARKMDRFCHFAIVAAREAIKDSGLDRSPVDKERIGVVIASGIGGIHTYYDNAIKLFTGGRKKVSPFFIPMLISDIASGYISIEHGYHGPNYAVSSACASAGNGIICAFSHIVLGDAEVIVTGGCEAAISPLGFAGFTQMQALSTHFNDSPEKGSRPFNKDRDGFVMGEGAGVLVLEDLEHAKKRGANILAELVSYGLSGDAHHITAPCPDGFGAALAMKNALKKGGIALKDVQLINSHGTSTPPGDLAETLAVKSTFGEYARSIKVNSTKSMIGHTLGAAGGIEAIAVVQMIREKLVHPTINLDNPDPECDLDYVPNKAVSCDITYGLSNSFGFGGHNVTLVFKKYE
jgi:3-oxoacyl-[acyl-carrier-protein] synthase II